MYSSFSLSISPSFSSPLLSKLSRDIHLVAASEEIIKHLGATKESQSSNQSLSLHSPRLVDICVHLRSHKCTASCLACTLNLRTPRYIVDYLDILSRSASSAQNSECSSYSTRITKHSVRSVETPSAIVTTPIIDDKSWATHARPTNQPTNQLTNQSTNHQPTNQPNNQPPSTTNNDNRVRSPNSYCVAVRACVSEDR